MQDKVEVPTPVEGRDVLDEVYESLVERASHWPDEWIEKGREQGLEQGLEHERALLCRQAESRFGAGTSEQLSVALGEVRDQNRLADIGDWLVRCDTGEEFLARAFPSPDGAEPSEV